MLAPIFGSQRIDSAIYRMLVGACGRWYHWLS